MSNYSYVATRARSRRSRLLPAEAYTQLLNLELSEIARYIQDLEYRREIDRYGSKLSGADLIETALVDNLAGDVGDFLSFSTGRLREILMVYAERYRVENLKNIRKNEMTTFLFCVHKQYSVVHFPPSPPTKLDVV